ncbi:hypothetical protein IMZ48_49275 [Candidatus Bathyarchaeota archaeon]|nr:hypothetical protein [Candidatus Bathyarchaeota archaeon]
MDPSDPLIKHRVLNAVRHSAAVNLVYPAAIIATPSISSSNGVENLTTSTVIAVIAVIQGPRIRGSSIVPKSSGCGGAALTYACSNSTSPRPPRARNYRYEYLVGLGPASAEPASRASLPTQTTYPCAVPSILAPGKPPSPRIRGPSHRRAPPSTLRGASFCEPLGWDRPGPCHPCTPNRLFSTGPPAAR